MNVAALLRVKAQLGKLRRKGALITDQFQLLKTRAKDGVVTDLEKWECNKLTASDRRILITQWTGEAAKKIDSDTAYRRRLFEKTELAMTADVSEDDLINL